MTYERLRNVLMSLLVLIAGFYLINLVYHAALSFSGIIFLYFTAWLISFLLSPIVDWLCKHRFPRLLAVSYVYLVLAALIIIMVLALVPTVINEGARLTDPRQFDVYRNALINHAANLQSISGGAHAFTQGQHRQLCGRGQPPVSRSVPADQQQSGQAERPDHRDSGHSIIDHCPIEP